MKKYEDMTETEKWLYNRTHPADHLTLLVKPWEVRLIADPEKLAKEIEELITKKGKTKDERS